MSAQILNAVPGPEAATSAAGALGLARHTRNERGPSFRQGLSMTAKAMPGIRPQPYLVLLLRRRRFAREGGARTAAAPDFGPRSLHDLAVERNVQTFHLDVPCHPQPDRPVDQLEDDKGRDD